MKEQPSYPGPTEGVGFVPSSLRPPTDVPVFPENGTACDKLYSLKQPRDSLADFPSSPIAQLRSTNACQAKPSQGIQMVTPLPSPPREVLAQLSQLQSEVLAGGDIPLWRESP